MSTVGEESLLYREEEFVDGKLTRLTLDTVFLSHFITRVR